LEKNKNQLVNAFKELLSSKLLEPLMILDELLKSLTDEIELVAFACDVN